MEEADVLCDRVGIMKEGNLIALGTCQRLRKEKKTEKRKLEKIG